MQPPEPPDSPEPLWPAHPSPDPAPASPPSRPPSASPTSGDPRPRRRPPILATVATLVVVCLFIVLLGAHAAGSNLIIPFFGASAPTGPTAPADWQTYRDPAGLFSVRLPPTWTVRFGSGTDNFGDRTGSATETDEEINISDPAQGDAGPSVFVYASPIHTAFERHWYCQAFPGQHDSFHGIPAHYASAVWLFETGNAHFQIDYSIPSVIGPPHSSPIMLTPVPTPTPLPPSTVSTDQTLVDTILASFQPTDPHALACS